MSGNKTLPPPRRDPRSDPDDDEFTGTPSPPSSQRVDVVNVERGGGDSISAVANTMRRELAKLHQQASAFERTLEDQRRERTEALDRAERAVEHALSLEARLSRMETETQSLRRMHETALDDLQKMRAERDDLARAVEGAKQSTEEMARIKAELVAALDAREEAARNVATLETELAEIRKREHQEAAKGSDKDSEIAALEEKVDRLTAEVAAAQADASKSKSDLVKVRQELDDALAATAKEALESERQTAQGERERLERQLADARAAEEKLVVVRQDLAATEKALDDANAETTRVAREVDAARRERDAHVERAAMIERENAELRLAEERMRRELEGALQAAMHAEARAGVAERARIQVEDGVRQLRDEITTAFARIRLVAPSLAPPPADPLSARIAASVPPPPRPPGDYTPTPTSVLYGPDSNAGTSASRSAPAPAARPSTAPRPRTSVAPMTTASPEMSPHTPSPFVAAPSSLPSKPSSSPSASGSTAPSAPPRPALAPPVPRLFEDDPFPSAERGTAAYGVPPATRAATPLARRDELISKLTDPADARAAADALKTAPEWLRGPPTEALLDALSHADYDAERPVFEVARAWDREPLCRALLDALRSEQEPRAREHAAWLLKHLASPGALKDIAELATSDAEATGVRRWLLEALDRLAAGRLVGWSELAEIVTEMSRHADATLRDGNVGILMSLAPSEEKNALLLDILAREDDEVVLGGAIDALAASPEVELDEGVVSRLLDHPSDRVQRAAKDLVMRTTSDDATIDVD